MAENRDSADTRRNSNETESDDEAPADLPLDGKKQKNKFKQPWQSLFSTANLDNGRLTLQISNVEEHHHQHHFRIPRSPCVPKTTPSTTPKSKSAFEGIATPRLNVVIQIVGSRGDVQPFVAIGKVLQAEPYHHRVRVATHPNFKDFVEENGLEFFSIGGDPEALMSYMIKNPGILPGRDSIRSGEPSHRRADIAAILQGCWRSCVERGDGMKDAPGTNKDGTPKIWPADAVPKNNSPFIADAILANPPSYAHIHIAEKLGIPLQLSFTMPWSPTQAFPHPLANITPTNQSKTLTNYASFVITDTLTWQGLGDLFNKFRTKTLGLEPINQLWGATIIPRLNVPWTYCWSKALIPKPKDWGREIGISGFYFLDLATNYTPPPELQAFLDAGSPPVYIGFGSITLPNPEEAMTMILEAVKMAGVRALVSKGWGGLQCNDPPPEVFMLDNCPHDWLFPRVSCVVHHGGAGTTAIGIKLGKPTVVIPFFGDQPFWGGMVFRAGAGPKPVPFKKLTAEKLADCLKTALKPESLARAKELGQKVEHEDGTAIGAKQFQDNLNIDAMRCAILPERAAVWRIKHTEVRLSTLAAGVLITSGTLSRKNLEHARHREWMTDQGPMMPLGGAVAAIVSNAATAGMGIHNFHKNVRQIRHDEKARRSSELDRKSLQEQGARDISSDNVTRVSGEEAIDTYLGNIQDHMLASGRTSEESSIIGAHSLAGSTIVDNTTPSAGLDSILSAGPTNLHTPHNSQSSTLSPTFDPVLKHAASFSDRLRLHITRRGTFPGFKSPPLARSATDDKHLHAIAHEACKAANTVLAAGLNTPVELAFNLATGFHNAPILYFGDKSVRPPPRITGLATGAKAAAAELVLGLYGGVSGLVRQPVAQSREKGVLRGLPQGVASGVGGLVLKSAGGVLGVPGFLLKGGMMQVKGRGGREAERHVMATRRFLALEEMRTCSLEMQRLILAKWEDLVKRDGEAVAREGGRTKHGVRCSDGRRIVRLDQLPHTHATHRKDLAATLETASEKDLEDAVREAVKLTSNGDEDEDSRIADAVRENLRELRAGLQQKKVPAREGDEAAATGEKDNANGNVDGETDGTGKRPGLGKRMLTATGLVKNDPEGFGDVASLVKDGDLAGGEDTHLLQYEVWKRICEAHMGITPQSKLAVEVGAEGLH